MGVLTDSGVVSPAVTNFFDRKLLRRALPMLTFMRVAQRRPLRQRQGTTIVFRRIAALPVATTPLTEGFPPTGRAISATDITATIQQWGDYVTLTDFVQAVVEHPLLNDTNKVLGEQSAQTMDILMRNEANAGTTVYYGGAAANRAALLGIGHKIDTTILDRVIRGLEVQNSSHFTRLISAGVKEQTFPIRPCYWGVVHPDVLFTLQELAGFIPVEQYAGKGQVMEMEVGAYKNVRFLATTQQTVLADGGGTAVGDVKKTTTLADIYMTTIFAQDAIAAVPFDGMSLKNILKPVGSSGVGDPLNQQGTSGWKFTGAQKRLNENFLARIETTAGNNNP
jgi:N4-gp56 family major capsid protein